MKRIGCLLSIVAVSLAAAGCASSNDTTEDAPAATADEALTATSFLGTGAGRKMTIDGNEARQLPVDPQLHALVASMNDTSQNTWFHASAYTMDPGALGTGWEQTLNCHATRNFMAYDMMWRSDGSTPSVNEAGGSGDQKWAERWNPEYETMSCHEIQASKALSRFRRSSGYATSMSAAKTPARKKQLETSSAAAVASLLKGIGPSKVFFCHWDNNDDTDADAVYTLDVKKGSARVLVSIGGG
jgi:hypothetical protein